MNMGFDKAPTRANRYRSQPNRPAPTHRLDTSVDWLSRGRHLEGEARSDVDAVQSPDQMIPHPIYTEPNQYQAQTIRFSPPNLDTALFHKF